MKERRRSRGGAVIFSATKRIIVLIIICTITIAIFFARELLSDKKSEYVKKINQIEKLEVAIKDEEDKAEKLKIVVGRLTLEHCNGMLAAVKPLG